MGRNCYTKEDVEKFRAAVVKYLVPVADQVYRRQAQRLGKEYEEKFGPLGETTQDTSRWAWISDPWPWEKEGN